MNLSRSLFEEKLDGCKVFMKYRKVNTLLERKIIQWFEYVWKNGTAKFDETTITECLPPRLKGQLAVHIHMETLQKVALFKDCEASLMYELVLKLKLQVFSPGDYVCRKGDIGKVS
uniref:Cyclic nucleotide-binding domain-containing protein n=1 Tax=Panagrolaimus sp. JU765 TaxID=591449 RepID=A0AC34Q2V6_9BILA